MKLKTENNEPMKSKTVYLNRSINKPNKSLIQLITQM